MRGCRQLKRTRIVIHSTDSFGEYYLPILINRFSKVHPEVRISLRVMMSDEGHRADRSLSKRHRFFLPGGL